MRTKIETSPGAQEFERFDAFLRQVVIVPKAEINKREQAEKQAKEMKKAKNSQPSCVRV